MFCPACHKGWNCALSCADVACFSQAHLAQQCMAKQNIAGSSIPLTMSFHHCMTAHWFLLQDWLAAYDTCPSSNRTAFGRSGLLQQALVLEMNSDRFNALQVRTLGWNGQLPMLDLYYLIKRLSESGPGLQLSQVWKCIARTCLSYFAANCSSACSSTCFGSSFLLMSNKGFATHVACIGWISLHISLNV